ncbi:MAG: phosphatase PAP2 family protein [Gemmatimonadaceae bacterium]
MKRRARRLLVVVLAALPLLPRTAAAQADTLGSPIALFTYRDLVLAGSVAVVTLLARPFDDHYAARLQDSATQSNRKLQRLAAFVRQTAAPGSYFIGGSMYLGGRLSGNERLADLGLHGTEALVVGELVAVALKGVAGRQRPYVRPRDSNSYQLFRGFGSKDAFRSFPSGHATSAFAAAAAVTSETSRWWPRATWIIGPTLYGGAALAGVSRMYNNRHWASDVLVGAGIGTFAGLKVVRYQHTHPGNRVDRWMLAGSLTPAPDGGQTLRLSILPVPAGLTSNGIRR